jgi:hypothetical protein
MQQQIRENDTNKRENKLDYELRPEYDFDYSKAVRGKYYKRLLTERTNVAVLDPDIALQGLADRSRRPTNKADD